MVNHVWTTEGYLRDEYNGGQEPQKPTNPADNDQFATGMPSHDIRVVQGMADSKVLIKGHDSQEETFRCSQREKEIKLEKTPSKGDGLFI